MKFTWWRLRVCWYGLRWQRVWIWDHLYSDEWWSLFEDMGDDPREAFIEGWMRE